MPMPDGTLVELHSLAIDAAAAVGAGGVATAVEWWGSSGRW